MRIVMNGATYEGTCVQHRQDYLLELDREPEVNQGDQLTIELFEDGGEDSTCCIYRHTAEDISGNSLRAAMEAEETGEDIMLEVMGDHEYRLCMLELGIL